MCIGALLLSITFVLLKFAVALQLGERERPYKVSSLEGSIRTILSTHEVFIDNLTLSGLINVGELLCTQAVVPNLKLERELAQTLCPASVHEVVLRQTHQSGLNLISGLALSVSTSLNLCQIASSLVGNSATSLYDSLGSIEQSL